MPRMDTNGERILGSSSQKSVYDEGMMTNVWRGVRIPVAAMLFAFSGPLVHAQTTQPTTEPTADADERFDRNRVYTIDECLKRFELDERLSLCHVWERPDGSLAGFVEMPQYKAVLARATKKDVSAIKVLPEESKTEARFGIVTAEHAILRKGPGDTLGDRDNVSDLLLGEPVWILDRIESGAMLVHACDGYIGWVDEQNLKVIGGRAMSEILSHSIDDRTRQKTDAAIDNARQLLGAPYLWGGKTKEGIDCSGLAQTSFASQGILLPRDADQQANVGKLVATRYFRDALQPGDLLFFVSEHRGNVHHVAIYLGEGKYIEAAGKDVHISSFNPRDREYDKERDETFGWARRVIE